jgi:hypothetical protein
MSSAPLQAQPQHPRTRIWVQRAILSVTTLFVPVACLTPNFKFDPTGSGGGGQGGDNPGVGGLNGSGGEPSGGAPGTGGNALGGDSSSGGGSASCVQAECDDVYDNARGECDGGRCLFQACDSGWRDCNEKSVDGCESNSASDPRNCGGCTKAQEGDDCNVFKGVNEVTGVSCESGACKVKVCSAGFADCNGEPSDGCEVDTTSNKTRCGGCALADGDGENCTTKWPTSEVECVESVCYQNDCSLNFASCVNPSQENCETDLRTSELHCGGCGSECETNSGTNANTCSNKTCTPSCAANGKECDSNPKNGCNDLSTDEMNCGDCGISCDASVVANVTTNNCVAGECDPQCQPNFHDCDISRENGCETRTDDNPSYCGNCTTVCDSSAGAHVTANPCTASACVPVCSPGYADRDGNPANGCETKVIGLLGATGTSSTSNAISLSYKILGTAGTSRILLAFVAGGTVSPNTATAVPQFGGVAMTKAEDVPIYDQAQSVNENNGLALYYMLDGAIGAKDSTKTFTFNSNWGGAVAVLWELYNVAQTAPILTASSVGRACNIAANASLPIGTLPTGSFLIAGINATGTNGALGNPTPVGLTNPLGVVGYWASTATQGYVGYAANTTGNLSVGWNALTNCYGKGLVAAGLAPAP